ncbi:hypothetical protein CSPX01_11511, partial [Colletotrichum filicis]
GEVSENKEWWEWGWANGVSPDADADAGAGAGAGADADEKRMGLRDVEPGAVELLVPELLGLEIDEMEFGKCTSAECPATPDDDDVVPVVLLLTDVVAGIVDDSKREKDGSINPRFGCINMSRWKVNVTVDAEVKAEGQVQVQVAADVMVEAVLSNLTVGFFA